MNRFKHLIRDLLNVPREKYRPKKRVIRIESHESDDQGPDNGLIGAIPERA